MADQNFTFEEKIEILLTDSIDEIRVKNIAKEHMELFGVVATSTKLNNNDIENLYRDLRKIPFSVNNNKFNYSLIRNFILHQYSGDYHFLNIRDVQKFYHFYNFIKTHNFELANHSISNASDLRNLLVDIYLSDLSVDKTKRIKDIKDKGKIDEVVSLIDSISNYYSQDEQVSRKVEKPKVLVK